MIAVRTSRTIMAVPRRAWRALKAKTARTEPAKSEAQNTGLFTAFERMLSDHVDRVLRNLED